MISHRYNGFVKLFFITKQIVGYSLYWVVVWLLQTLHYGDRITPSNYVWLSLLVPAAASLEWAARATNRRSLCGLSREQISNITQREIIFALVTVFGAIVMARDATASRLFLALFFTLYACWIVWMNHVGHRAMYRSLYRNPGKGQTKTIVLASPEEIKRDRVQKLANNLPGSDLMGYVPFESNSSNPAITFDSASLPILGSFRDLSKICKQKGARMLLTAGIEDRPSLVKSLQSMCDDYGMRLVWIDDKEHKFRGRIDTHRDGNQVFVTRWSEPLEDPYARTQKRLVDFSFSVLIATTIFPFLCAGVWIIQRTYSPGALFYRQQRTGRNGEVFDVLKFRSMHENDNAGVQAQKGDSRIYPGGDFLRKSSLDEIPQFINVLKGQMSIVGPRPHYVEHDEKFNQIVANYQTRFFAKPGITGLAQVKGCRGETDTDLKVRQRVRLDNFYLRNWSPILDIRIIFLTAWHVINPPKDAR